MDLTYSTLPLAITSIEPIIYPESDGQPIADNTLQFDWIVTIEGSLQVMFKDDPNVFVAGDLLWYPVEGNPQIRRAPDVLVAFGRPKGHRGSYLQWEEDNISPQVVFEILSPHDTEEEMRKKLAFYDRYKVEEYYAYDPNNGTLEGWCRNGGRLVPIAQMEGWVSPRLNVRFDMKSKDILIYRPDGRRFLSFVELNQELQTLVKARLEAEARQAETRQAEARCEAEARAKAEAKARREAEAEIARLRALLAQRGS